MKFLREYKKELLSIVFMCINIWYSYIIALPSVSATKFAYIYFALYHTVPYSYFSFYHFKN